MRKGLEYLIRRHTRYLAGKPGYWPANLRGANLRGANLSEANLSEADLSWAVSNHTTVGFNLACPEVGGFTGFKKCDRYIVKLQIPDHAKRSSATTMKCRASEAIVLNILNTDGTDSDISSVKSDYDHNFIYEVGKTVSVPNFDENRWNECAPGIHFFLAFDVARHWDS